PGGMGPQAMGESDPVAGWWIGPNPTRGGLFVAMPGINGLFAVDLLDLRGRQLRSEEGSTSGTVELDLHGLAAGTYLVHVRSDGLHKTFRLVRE
ncbi:MAG: T9SS type A sorting domain-containing protein, partial [Flavobacteriales bacterium]|nr:T9SS type A sorting domain-containing protein [Flavobacteriales bacterium]